MTSLRGAADPEAEVGPELRRLLAEREASALTHGDEFALLWRLAGEQIADGKMLRPRMLLRLHAALSDRPDPAVSSRCSDSAAPRTVLQLACAIELLHFAFLLHDDVIDGDLQRRHAPNLIARLQDQHPAPARGTNAAARHWGCTGAILMGDLLLTEVHRIFALADLPAAVRTRMLRLLHSTISTTVAGELTDTALSDGVIADEPETVLRMTAEKTAAYSFALPLRLAVILAGRGEDLETVLATVSRALGLAYQVQDDALAMFGDGRSHGKDPCSDLREGKRTTLVAHARRTGAWEDIAPRFGAADLTEAEADAMRDRFRACGAEEFAHRLVAQQLARARAGIADAARAGLLPPPARAVLDDVVGLIDGRAS
ncbi:polyprenyl synthetase family protein [Microbacterium soli]